MREGKQREVLSPELKRIRDVGLRAGEELDIYRKTLIEKSEESIKIIREFKASSESY